MQCKRSSKVGCARGSRRGLAWVWLLGCLAFSSLPAQAHKRNFAWSYEWFTPAKGEKEVEVWLTFKEPDGESQTWLEYEFGVSDRYGVGLYLTAESTAESTLGWKWENRYRFGQYRTNRWLRAGYLELKKEEGEPYETEAKWLFSHYTQSDEALAFNLITEKALTPGAPVEWGYSAGWNRPLNSSWRVGLESFGEFADHQYYLGPNATYDVPGRNLRLIFGSGIGVGKASGDVVWRAIAEWEFF